MCRIIVSIIVFLAINPSLYASTVNYEVTSLGSNRWEYSYTIHNDMLSVDIEEISIYFDLGVYENLSVGSAPPDWDVLVFQPDPILAEDGLYDALALVAGIIPGESLGGFTVQFDYLPGEMPGAQWFETLDPFTFEVLDSGFTTEAHSVIPLPGTLPLLLSGIFGMYSWNRRCKSNRRVT